VRPPGVKADVEGGRARKGMKEMAKVKGESSNIDKSRDEKRSCKTLSKLEHKIRKNATLLGKKKSHEQRGYTSEILRQQRNVSK